MKRIVLIIVLALMLVSCAPDPNDVNYLNESEIVEESNDYSAHWDLPLSISVYRFKDEENNVVCYAMDGYEAGGISCVLLGNK